MWARIFLLVCKSMTLMAVARKKFPWSQLRISCLQFKQFSNNYIIGCTVSRFLHEAFQVASKKNAQNVHIILMFFAKWKIYSNVLANCASIDTLQSVCDSKKIKNHTHKSSQIKLIKIQSYPFDKFDRCPNKCCTHEIHFWLSLENMQAK